jgi:Bacterial Ig domain
MKHAYAFATRPIVAAGLALLSLLAAPAQAINYTLVAAPIAASPMPDGAPVAMWGYRVCAGTVSAAACTAALTSPGAALVVPPGDNVLGVTLHNQLPGVPTSFVVHGLNTAMAPVFTNSPTAPGTASNCTPGVGADDATRRACRVRSFTSEAAPGGSATYTYNNVRPGTYLYQSGTLPQIQVQMGLYGMMSKDAGVAGSVYPGVTYTNQSRVIFSEVDAAMHTAVAAGTFTGSTLDYDPKHFRTHVYNESTHLPEQVNAGASSIHRPGAPHLIRMANAGLQTRVPTLNNGTWALLGEDAQPYPHTREQYTAFLPAAKTTEAWIGGPARAVTLFDRRMAFADAAPGAVAGQFLRFSPVAPAQLSHNCGTTATQGVLYTCTASSTTAGATVTVTGPTGMTFAAGTVNWTPTNAQAQKPATPTLTHPVTITASAPGSEATASSFAVTVANVNDAPTALADGPYTAALGSLSLTVPVATGVLVNDSDIDGDTLTAVAGTVTGTGTLALNPDGSFSFTLPAGTLLPQTRSFTYTASDGLASSNAVVVTLTFPVGFQANADPLTFTNTTARTPQTIAVLANDTSNTVPAFQLGSIQVSRTIPVGAGVDSLAATATQGGVTTPADGTIVYTAPLNVNANVSFAGTDTFYYRVNNNTGTPSNWAQVTVTVNAAPAPATVADAFTFINNGSRPVQVFNVLANDTVTTGFNTTNVEVARESTGAGGTAGALAATTLRGAVSTPGATGTVTYVAPTNGTFGVAGFTGPDYFHYRVMNTSGVWSAWTRVDVTIVASPVVAVANAYTLVNTTARPTIVLNVLANDTSNTVPAFDLNSIQISETGTDAGFDSLAAGPGVGAIATPNNNTGTITFQAAPNTIPGVVSFVGSETFYYRVSNNAGVQSNWATVTVTTVAGPPVAAPNTFNFVNNATRPVQTFNVLGNDSASVLFNFVSGVEIKRNVGDATGTSTGTLAATATRGEVSTPNITGTITYRAPLGDFNGTDTFYYRVQDVNGNWSEWTLVTVNMT